MEHAGWLLGIVLFGAGYLAGEYEAKCPPRMAIGLMVGLGTSLWVLDAFNIPSRIGIWG